MAVIYNSNQVKWGDKGYLDAKMQPVPNVSSLPTEFAEVFEGMTVVVLNDGSGQPHDYWYINGQWVKKDAGSGSSEEVQALADAIGDGFSSANTVADAIGTMQTKLNGIEDGAEANVNADWNAESGDALILNKPDLSAYITKAVDDLVNYYTKTETYSKAEVDALVDAIPRFNILCVDELPTENISTTTIYLLRESNEDRNLYTEYIRVNNAWEKLGSLDIDLSDYVTSGQLQDAIDEVMAEFVGYATKDDLTAATVSINTAITELQTSVAELAPKVAETEAAVESLQNTVDAIDDTYATKSELTAATDGLATEAYVDTAVSEVQDALDTLDGKVETLSSAVTEVKDAIDAIDDTYATKDEVNAVDEKVDAINGQVSAMSATVIDLTSDLEVLEENLVDAQDDIDEAFSALTDVQEAIEGLDDEYAKKEEVAGLKDEVSALTESVEDKASKEELQNAITALTESIDELDTESSATTEAIDALTDSVAELEDNLNNKQDAFSTGAALELNDGVLNVLVDGTTIKVDEQTNKLHVIGGGEGSASYIPGDYINISGDVISVTGITPDEYATKQELEDEVTALTEAISTVADTIENEYAKKEDIEDFATKEDVANAVTASTEGFATEEWVNEQGFLKEHQSLEDYATKQDLNDKVTALTASITEIADTLENDYATKEDLNNLATAETMVSAITDAVNEAIEGMDLASKDDIAELPSKEYVDEAISAATEGLDSKYATDDEVLAAVAVATEGLASEDYVDAAVSSATEGFATEAYVDEAVSAATEGLAEKDYVDEAISSATEGLVSKDYVDAAVSAATEGVATKDDLNEAISAVTEAVGEDFATKDELLSATTGMATQEWVNEQGFLTEHQSLEDYVTATALTEALSEVSDGFEDEIAAATSALSEEIAATYAEKSELEGLATEEWVNEQGFLTEHQSLTDYAKQQALDNEIERAELAEAILVDDLNREVERAISAETELKEYVDAAVSAATDMDEIVEVVDEKVLSAKTEMEEYVDTVAAGKQDLLSAGTYVDITDNVISVVGINPNEFATKDEISDMARLEDVVDIVSSAVTEIADERGYIDAEHAEEIINSAVTEYIDAQGYVTEDAAKEFISTAVTEYIDAQGYVTKTEVEDVVSSAVTDYVDAQGYVTSQDVADAITAATEGFVTSSDVDQAISAATANLVNADEMAQAISDATSDFVTEDEVLDAITAATEGFITESALEGYATEEYVDNKVSALTEQFSDYATTAVVESFYNEYQNNNTEIANAISSAYTNATEYTDSAVTGLASEQWVGENYATKDEISDFATKDEVAEAMVNSLTGYTTTDYVDEQVSALTSEIAGKQDKLEAGEHITIEGNVISAVGFATEEFVNSAETRMQDYVDGKGYVTEEEVAEAIADSGFVTSADVETAIENYATENELATKTDVLTAKTEATDAAIAGATAWTASQEYAKEEDVRDTVNDLLGIISASTEDAVERANAYADTAIADAVTAATGEYSETFATKEELAEARTASTADAIDWVEEQNYATKADLEEKDSDLENKIDEAITAATEYTDNAVLTAMTEAKAYADSVVDEALDDAAIYTDTVVSSALTEAKDYADSAASSALTNANAYTDAAVSSAITEAEAYADAADAEVLADAKEYTDNAVVDAISSAVTHSEEYADDAAEAALLSANSYTDSAVQTASAELEAYANDAASSALTEAKDYTDDAIEEALGNITHPEYSIESIQPVSNDYVASYCLTKDSSAITGSETINIPKVTGVSLQSALTADTTVGFVSAGTVFSAGTSIEDIIRAIFVSSGEPTPPTPANTAYYYYGCYNAWDDDEWWDYNVSDENPTFIASAITTYLTRSENEASAGSFEFNTVNDTQLIAVVVPTSLTVTSILNGMDGNEMPSFSLRQQVTINNVVYNCYGYAEEGGLRITGGKIKITTVNA